MNDVLTEQVISALAEMKHLRAADITPDRTLESLKLDSLDVITLAFELEDVVGVNIPDEHVRNVRTVSDIIEGIRRLKEAPAAGT